MNNAREEFVLLAAVGPETRDPSYVAVAPSLNTLITRRLVPELAKLYGQVLPTMVTNAARYGPAFPAWNYTSSVNTTFAIRLSGGYRD
jgi:hypothetical protein